ncbi:hypothetical protein HYR54_09115 [Candidatus Acetothermia bacterium]|nr:hypothetical protein [Candidatus Acetothermia bacterium]
MQKLASQGIDYLMHEILESLQPVITQSTHVRIDESSLERFCQKILRERPKIPSWNYQHHFYDGTEKTVAYLLVLDSLNFCFWPEPSWEIVHKNEKFSGYPALAVALKRAIEEGIPIGDADFLSTVSLETLSHIFRGNGHLPLLERRLDILHELGTVLKTQYQGQAHYLIEAAQGSAIKLIQRLVTDFPSFRDEALYKRHRVLLRKRAQIFVADLHGSFEGKRWGEFHDIGQLTIFADYVLPQVLRQLGILQYSPSLAERVDHYETIEASSPEEVEIRAHTIWAVELLRRRLTPIGLNLRAFELDWILWNMGQEPTYEAKPHHRTRTIFY